MDGTDAAAGTVSTPELREHLRTAAAQRAEVHGILEGLTDAQSHWRPGPRRWSVGEHVEHLAIVNRRYVAAAERAVEKAFAKGLTGTGRGRRARRGAWVRRNLEPPPRPRSRTLRARVPNPERPRAGVLAEFDAAHDALSRLLVRADGVDLGRATMRSPFLWALKLTLGQVFRAIPAHNRRHLWLMREVLAEPGFPGGGGAGGGAGAAAGEDDAANDGRGATNGG